jgi:hypothetical protein
MEGHNHSGADVGNRRKLANAVHHAGVLSLNDDRLDSSVTRDKLSKSQERPGLSGNARCALKPCPKP